MVGILCLANNYRVSVDRGWKDILGETSLESKDFQDKPASNMIMLRGEWSAKTIISRTLI